MTRDEAQKIAYVIGFAEGGYDGAVEGLAELLNASDLGWAFTLTSDREMKRAPGDAHESAHVGVEVKPT